MNTRPEDQFGGQAVYNRTTHAGGLECGLQCLMRRIEFLYIHWIPGRIWRDGRQPFPAFSCSLTIACRDVLLK